MKKITITIMLIFVLTMNLFAFNAEEFDGKDWNLFSIEQKNLMIFGALVGLLTATDILEDLDAPDTLITKFIFPERTTVERIRKLVDEGYLEYRHVPLSKMIWISMLFLKDEMPRNKIF